MPVVDGAWTFGGLCDNPFRVADQIFEKCYEEDSTNWRSNVLAILSSLVKSADSWQTVRIVWFL